eukprot:4491939-Prymnesium_polylepis.1
MMCFHTRTTTVAPSTLQTHSEPEDTPPLPTPSRWDDAVTVTLLPGRAHAGECERAHRAPVLMWSPGTLPER